METNCNDLTRMDGVDDCKGLILRRGDTIDDNRSLFLMVIIGVGFGDGDAEPAKDFCKISGGPSLIAVGFVDKTDNTGFNVADGNGERLSSSSSSSLVVICCSGIDGITE